MSAIDWILTAFASICLSVAAVGIGAIIVIMIMEYIGRKH